MVPSKYRKTYTKLEGSAKYLRNNKIDSKKLYRQITRPCNQRDFFANRIVPIWNKLPNYVINATNINSFNKECHLTKKNSF